MPGRSSCARTAEPAPAKAGDSAGRKDRVVATLPRPAGAPGAAPSVTLEFGYDAGGNRTAAIWSGGRVDWVYDGLNRVESVSADGSPVAAYQYDLLGRRTGNTRGAGPSAVTSIYGYDRASQLTRLQHAWVGGGVAFDYT